MDRERRVNRDYLESEYVRTADFEGRLNVTTSN